ncbi:sodium/hydrogen antiporter [Cyphellophora europaea CBS 101466]|uniref:Sodium/hydrogen antiporter n=1 Tax=Cyphellophora europaea (strain CBS 101466) TaxID=1220924 RepID=W2SAC7_CYPE1|nr:sodium/hydrogen antiporter [Cyphellophora europaea CBS 101466]ETN44854.1 sodium/hydrogen antiporter [Cyphellophora europaea CBS 101466]
MAWEHLSINKPHLVYIILGGFTSIFMLVSLFIKEKLYIGEATVATICGVIFGPHAANLINPLTWGNTDQITLEFSRIVLVVQCFAVGVELPKAYMERHWRSVVFLLVPVMTFGWLITSVFIWWMIVPLSWLESLAVAACVTATDPVLASSVVGKGKFAKRIPKHLRDILSAESGCNDGMAFPFIYLSIYLLRYDLDAAHVTFHWFCYTILYECIFGAIYGVCIGYIGRRAIRFCEEKGIIDRESFLVFYFVLALFCAGSGSLLGMDDLLIGFCAGVGFSNDGWFTEQTEESHVSNVIDLLINLSYFVYLGTIIPWAQYNAPDHGLTPWRLVVIAIFVIFFRRIPIMLMCKPFIPDIKTWREALFAGHFGPIGVGAIFVAILARAELETETTDPLDELPAPGTKDYDLIYLVWPIVTFLVISSILVHGSSIAVFTLGKRINTLTITMSYTKDPEEGPSWMNRLPRISSQGRTSSRMSSFSVDEEEKMVIPKLQLRRQKEEEYNEKADPRSLSATKTRRRKRRGDSRLGGPVSASAIAPASRSDIGLSGLQHQESGLSGSDTLLEKSSQPSPETQKGENSTETSPERGGPRDRRPSPSRSRSTSRPAEVEAYDEGEELVVEDEEGNVLTTRKAQGLTEEDKANIIEEARRSLDKDATGRFSKHKNEPHEKDEGMEMAQSAADAASNPQKTFRQRLTGWRGFTSEKEDEAPKKKPSERKRGAAHAFQIGNTIIVEDEDGEVIKEYTLPASEDARKRTYGQDQLRSGMHRMGTYLGVARKPDEAAAAVGATANPRNVQTKDEYDESSDRLEAEEDPDATETVEKQGLREGRTEQTRPVEPDDDDGLRLTISRAQQYGWTGLQRKQSAAGGQLTLGSGRRLSTKDFLKQMQELNPKDRAREVARSDAPEGVKRELKRGADAEQAAADALGERPKGLRRPTDSRTPLQRPDDGSQNESGDYFSVRPRGNRTRTDRTIEEEEEDTDLDTPAERPAETPGRDIPTHDVRSAVVRHSKGQQTAADQRRQRLATISSNDSGERDAEDEEPETMAEKRRRLAALYGGRGENDSDDEDEDERPRPANKATQEPAAGQTSRSMTVQWGGETGRDDQPRRDDGEEKSAGGSARKLRGIFKR